MASWIWEVVPFAAMLTLDFTDAGVYIINKAALVEGMSEFVSVVYSNALGTIILLPYFIFHRRRRAPLTFPLLCRFFLLALIGSTGQILSSTGIKLSSPTLLSAMANLIPIFTFLLAVIFRMEALDLRRSTSQAKSLGAVLSVAGAFLVTLYKGPAIWMTSTSGSHHQLLLLSKQSDWILGGFLFLIVSILAAGWTILQGATIKEYPEGMTIVFFFTFFVTIQAAVFAVIFEGYPYAWRVKPGTELIFIVCSAVFGSLIRIAIQTWCLHWKGPVFVAMFRPLEIAITVFMTIIILGDTLYLGSVVGSLIIAIGFYSVMWGQIKERNMALESEGSSSRKAPLLQSNHCNAYEDI